MKYSIFLLLVACSLGIFSNANAQEISTSQTTINIELTPEVPGPNEVVYVALTSYATDLNAANITWKVNGKNIKSGIGEKDFTFSSGPMNTRTTLSVTIRTVEGELIEKNLVLKPSDVDMIWQSKSFVPPFYKGKAMFSHQNEITFIAIPHITGSNGQEINSKNLIYKWRKNGSVMQDYSGYGKNTFTFVAPLISRAIEISVEATPVNGDGIATGYTFIDPIEPSIVFYKKDPIFGIRFQNALQNINELNNSLEIAVIAMPFNFGVLDSLAPELIYKWKINDLPLDGFNESNLQVFRQIEGVSGSSNISLSIENSRKILQYTSGKFDLGFGGGE